MSQAHDSFSIFLKNVKKKKESKDEPVATTEHLDMAILDSLARKGALSVQDLMGAHKVSVTQMFDLLGQLRKADLVTVDPTTDMVELTDYGRQAAKLQQIAGSND